MSLSIEREPLKGFIERLREPRRFLQVVAGPRQVGKTTLVKQTLAAIAASPKMSESITLAQHSVSADSPGLRGRSWLAAQWEIARSLAAQAGACVLVLDEVQKLPDWTEEVKRLWDEDTASGRDVRAVVLGSAPLLISRGLTESMAGRFEITRLAHWRYAEMREAFDFSLDDYIFYGSYPGAAEFIRNEKRWASYVRDAMIETTIGKDVLLMSPVQKPALLRRVFDLACRYSGQQLSYQKMMGQLGDAGNTTTLAHYLELLEGAGMVCGLQKYAGQAVRQRASSPKLQVFNTALMGSLAVAEDFGFKRVRSTPDLWGRMVESAIGAELLAREPEHSSLHPRLYYWSHLGQELDFVVPQSGGLQALEIKSGRTRGALSGLDRFCKSFPQARPMIVGAGGMTLEQWFLHTA